MIEASRVKHKARYQTCSRRQRQQMEVSRPGYRPTTVKGNPNSDFNVWGARAGGIKRPQVSAVVMTMVGARSATKGVKDRASQMYVERAYEVAAKHADLFDVDNPADAFVITDDFTDASAVPLAFQSHN
jgi:hypothetical protein